MSSQANTKGGINQAANTSRSTTARPVATPNQNRAANFNSNTNPNSNPNPPTQRVNAGNVNPNPNPNANANAAAAHSNTNYDANRTAHSNSNPVPVPSSTSSAARIPVTKSTSTIPSRSQPAASPSAARSAAPASALTRPSQPNSNQQRQAGNRSPTHNPTNTNRSNPISSQQQQQAQRQQQLRQPNSAKSTIPTNQLQGQSRPTNQSQSRIHSQPIHSAPSEDSAIFIETDESNEFYEGEEQYDHSLSQAEQQLEGQDEYYEEEGNADYYEEDGMLPMDGQQDFYRDDNMGSDPYEEEQHQFMDNTTPDMSKTRRIMQRSSVSGFSSAPTFSFSLARIFSSFRRSLSLSSCTASSFHPANLLRLDFITLSSVLANCLFLALLMFTWLGNHGHLCSSSGGIVGGSGGSTGALKAGIGKVYTLLTYATTSDDVDGLDSPSSASSDAAIIESITSHFAKDLSLSSFASSSIASLHSPTWQYCDFTTPSPSSPLPHSLCDRHPQVEQSWQISWYGGQVAVGGGTIREHPQRVKCSYLPPYNYQWPPKSTELPASKHAVNWANLGLSTFDDLIMFNRATPKNHYHFDAPKYDLDGLDEVSIAAQHIPFGIKVRNLLDIGAGGGSLGLVFKEEI